MRRVCYSAIVVGLLIAAAVALVMWHRWANKAPHRQAAAVLSTLDQELRRSNDQGLLNLLAMPPAMAGRTVSEQAEFVRKALGHEISPEGLAA